MACRTFFLAGPILAATLGAARGEGAEGYPAVPPSPSIVKPESAAGFAEQDRRETIVALVALCQAAPGTAIARPLQSMRLPASLATAADVDLIGRFAASRAAFTGVYSELEHQLLCGIAAHRAAWQAEAPASAAVAAVAASLEAVERSGDGCVDLTALEQRRAICAAGDGFASSPSAKRFEHRRQALLAAKASASPPPQPPPVAGAAQF